MTAPRREDEAVTTRIDAPDVDQLDDLRLQARDDRRLASPRPAVVALWLGGDRSEVAVGDRKMQLGGDHHLSPMQALLGCLAACQVQLVAMHAARLGVELHEMWVDTTGDHDLTSFLGEDDPDGPGLREIHCTIRIRTGPANDEQIQELTRLCRTSSSVADSLGRRVPVATSIEVASSR